MKVTIEVNDDFYVLTRIFSCGRLISTYCEEYTDIVLYCACCGEHIPTDKLLVKPTYRNLWESLNTEINVEELTCIECVGKD